MYSKSPIGVALRTFWLATILCVACLALPGQTAGRPVSDAGASGAGAHSIPLTFEPNRGQAAASYEFLLRLPGFTAGTRRDGFDVVVSGNADGEARHRVARVRWTGVATPANGLDQAPEAPVQTGEAPSAHRVNYWEFGEVPRELPRDVPTFGKVRQRAIYPHIDLVYHGTAQRLEYDFVVEPQANPYTIGFTVESDENAWIDAEGNLRIGEGEIGLVQRKPIAYQMANGQRIEVAAHLEPRGTTAGGLPQFGFAVEKYDKTLPLVIDPIVEKAFFFGAERNYIERVVVDSAGGVYLQWYSSTALPGSDPLAPIAGTAYTQAVTRLSPDLNAAVYTTYVSFATNPQVRWDSQLAVLPNGDLYFASGLFGDNYNTSVTVGPYGYARDASVHRYAKQVFVARITGNGTSLGFSTIVACRGDSQIGGLATDSAGNAILTVRASGTEFPYTPGAFGAGPEAGASGTYALKLSPQGGLVYSARIASMLGALSVLVDALDRPVLIGTASGDPAYAEDVPITAGAYQQTVKGTTDAYLCRLSKDGSTVLTATFVGGSDRDSLQRAQFDSMGNLLLRIATSSVDLPVGSGVFQPQPPVGLVPSDTPHALLKVSADFSTVLNATYVHLGVKLPSSVFADSSGQVYLYFNELTYNNPLPPGTAGSMFPYSTRIADYYLARLSQDWSTIEYATYFPGGTIAPLPNQQLMVVGHSFDPKPSGDEFPPVTDPAGIRFGAAEPTLGNIWIGLFDMGSPQTCNVTVSPTEFSFSPDGQTRNVSVSGQPNCPWKFDYWGGSFSEVPRLAFQPDAGYGSGNVAVTAEPNNSSRNDLQADLRVGTSLVRFTQGKASCDRQVLNVSNLTFTAEGGFQMLRMEIPDSCGWTATSDSPWAKFAHSTGSFGPVDTWSRSYTDEFRVVVEPNSFEPRTTTLHIGKFDVLLTQGGGACTSTLTPASQTVAASGGTVSFQLNAAGTACPWTAHLRGLGTLTTPAEGSGSTTIQVTVPKNETNVPRSGSVFVAGKSATFNQPGSPCEIQFQPPSMTFPKGGGTRTLNVYATGEGCTYNTVPSVDWLHLHTHTVFGNGFILFSADPNPSEVPRTGSLRLLGTEYPIYQEGGIFIPKVTLTSSPVSGMRLVVNGSPVVTPATVSFGGSSSMTIEAPELWNVSDSHRVRFRSWSNGGMRSQVIAAPVLDISLNAYVGSEYKLSTAVEGAGAVDATPTSADGFYEAGTQVSLRARTLDPTNLIQWVGDLSGSANPQVLTMNGPKSVLLRVFSSSTTPELRFSAPLPTLRFRTDQQVLAASIQVTSTGAPVRLGALPSTCEGASGMVSAEFSNLDTPSTLTVRLVAELAESVAPGTYQCSVNFARHDTTSPTPIALPVTVVIGSQTTEQPTIMAAVDGASFRPLALAPGSIFSLFGTGLADAAETADRLPLPTSLQGTRVVLAAGGVEWDMPLFYVSPHQINVLVPEAAATGPATIRLLRNGGVASSLPVTIEPLAPSLFTANSDGKGAPAGYIVRVEGNSQIRREIADCPSGAGSCVPLPVEWGPENATVYLVLFGTGFRGQSNSPEVWFGGRLLPVEYVGPQGQFAGLDQINIKLPRSLVNLGEGDLSIIHGGHSVNSVRLHF